CYNSSLSSSVCFLVVVSSVVVDVSVEVCGVTASASPASGVPAFSLVDCSSVFDSDWS
uniref:Secreted protein n=1 Tax=Ciona intestinalis TaxID=7719 RepID=H2XV58_CIOIN